MPRLRLRGFERNLAYDVKITDSAVLDAEEYVSYIQFQKREPEAAEQWLRGLISAILSLNELPSRYTLIPEGKRFPFELRQLVFHSHRIVYHIDEAKQMVTVLRIYHGSRRRLRRADIEIQDL